MFGGGWKSILTCAYFRFSDKEVQKDMKLFPFKIVNQDGKPYIQVKIKDGETKVFSPEEISAMILTKMKETAEAFLGKKIKDAVVTVPGEYSLSISFIASHLILLIFVMFLIDIIFHSNMQHTSMMPRDRQPRMLVSLLDSMLLGLSMNLPQQLSHMVWTRRVVKKISLFLTLVVVLLMSVF